MLIYERIFVSALIHQLEIRNCHSNWMNRLQKKLLMEERLIQLLPEQVNVTKLRNILKTMIKHVINNVSKRFNMLAFSQSFSKIRFKTKRYLRKFDF